MRHHSTYEKFGGDGSLIHAYRHWSVLIRPKQATLGAMVMVAHAEVTAVSALPDEAFAEQASVVRDVEAALRAAFAPDKINYLTLMMVDPHVHAHILPRYETPRAFAGSEKRDVGWPGVPDLSASVGDVAAAAKEALSKVWPAA
ncbi:HIT domain-containing protein [Parvularcula dongshanensis]|uniref:Diadenosine tetraphosphate (Ap4A) HIT family hydrolase n=1 Tax=Parvularcula dongshanensis TaxID=1173995 RepID=A0A840I4N8_9PROT|nr:diadenosine tetraphosphate (Ap4A) HIT family hydrolase [Parvularcula dongshanensis]